MIPDFLGKYLLFVNIILMQDERSANLAVIDIK